MDWTWMIQIKGGHHQRKFVPSSGGGQISGKGGAWNFLPHRQHVHMAFIAVPYKMIGKKRYTVLLVKVIIFINSTGLGTFVGYRNCNKLHNDVFIDLWVLKCRS